MGGGEIRPFQIPASSHAVLFYETEEEMYKWILPFIKEGLENGESVIYVSDGDDVRCQREFENYGIDVKAHKGLMIVDVEDWYLERGNMDKEKVVKKWMDATCMAKELGFRRMRVTGGSTYFFKNDMVGSFMAYERSLPRYFTFPMTVICRYKISDVASYDEGRLLPELLKIHSYVITPNLAEEIDFPEYYLESINETLDSIFGEATRQTLLYHMENKYGLPMSEIPMRTLEFRRALESLLGTGGKLIEHAILKHLYSKTGLRYDSGDKRHE